MNENYVCSTEEKRHSFLAIILFIIGCVLVVLGAMLNSILFGLGVLFDVLGGIAVFVAFFMFFFMSCFSAKTYGVNVSPQVKNILNNVF